jgi:hypothetical protein
MFRQVPHDRKLSTAGCRKAKYPGLQTIYFYAFKEGDYYIMAQLL